MAIPLAGEGVFFAMLSQEQKEAVLAGAAEEAALRFEQYVDSLVQAFDFRELDAQGRLATYKARSYIEWSNLQQVIPQEFAKQLQDYYIIERRVANAGGPPARPSQIPEADVRA